MLKQKQIRRGEIYYADLNPVVGSEQGDIRPVLVIQNDIGNKYSPTIVIAPLTCNLNKNPIPTHVFIPKQDNLEQDSVVLAEQIRTIDRSRISGYIGSITREQQLDVDAAVAVSVGIGIEKIVSYPPKKPEILNLCLCHRCESDFV